MAILSFRGGSSRQLERELGRSLGVVEDAVRTSAARRADEMVGAAGRQAEEERRRADAHATERVVRARAEGEKAADPTARAMLARARSDARTSVLTARRLLYEKVRSEAVADVVRRLENGEAPRLQARLAGLTGTDHVRTAAQLLVDDELNRRADDVRSLWQ